MTPEQIDAITNAWVWADDKVHIYGPGLAVAAGLGSCWWTARRIRIRRGLRRLEHYANHPGAQRLLDDIHNQPRKEEDR